MKIGIICYPTYGGSGVVATELGRFLARRGHEVHFISSSIPFRLALEANESIIFHEVHEFQYPLFGSQLYTLSLASKCIQIANEYGLEIIHAHYAIPHAVSGWIAREALKDRHTLRLVTTLHGTDITLTGRAPSFFPVVKHALEQSDAITAVSEWLAEETRDGFGPSKPIEVIPNFVDSTKFRPSLTPCRRNRFAPNGEKIVLHISNFRPVKRMQDVVGVFAKICAEMPAKLLLIGDGPEYDRTVQLAHELKVFEHIHFLGKQDQIETYFSCADLFLLPSEYESFGLAAIEAMSSEIPVVASRAGGLTELIRHGETGFLAPMGNQEEMAKCGLSVLRDPDLAERIRHAARKDVMARFQPDKIVAQYESLYENVLSSAPRIECRPGEHLYPTQGHWGYNYDI